MKTLATISLTAFMCAGCAAPLPLTVATLFADGVSYATTEKSLTDHGLSALSDQDCAMHRVLTEGAMCRDSAYGTTAVAAVAAVNDTVPSPTRQLQQPEFRNTVATPKNHTGSRLDSVADPVPGVYMVLASTRDRVTAHNIGVQSGATAPQVFAMPAGGRRVIYHVIVGPVTRSQYPGALKTAAKHGYPKAWALMIDENDWRKDREIDAIIEQRLSADRTSAIN
ncbi:hypothetical protein L2D14_09335 [Thalassospiraceae bacterium LMO-JJ14]|nr:hypothetical protein L2D14_09335 [Thalassospiraceae bacterium LMO-JJ14]